MIARKIFGVLCMTLVGVTSLQAGRHHSSSSSNSSNDKNKKVVADYVIVGLGSSGSVLARYLSDPVNGKYKNSVLVLEAGVNRSDDPIINAGPNEIFGTIDELAYSSKYALTKNCPEDNPNNPNIGLFGFFPVEQYSSGRMWFGTSAHDFMVDVRGSTDRWDELAATVGDSQWSYNALLPYMKFIEKFVGNTEQPSYRGFTGPLQVSQVLPNLSDSEFVPHVFSDVTGAPILDDYNVPNGNTAISTPQNFATADQNQRTYGRDFLPTSILGNDGKGKNGRKLNVLSNAVAHRVIFKGNKAIGVEYFIDNSNVGQIVYAKKEVILCAGCPHSAAILQRSGIGPRTVLQDPKVNVPVLVNNPLVGTGLKEHYGILYGMTQPENPSDQFFQEILGFTDGRNFFDPAGTGDDVRRFELVEFPTLAVLPPSLISAASIDESVPGFAGPVWNLRPRSSGTAFIVDDSPFTLPDIRFNLYSDGDLSDPASDLSASVAAFKIMNEIATELGVTMLYPPPSHFAAGDAQLAFDAGAVLNYSQLTMTNHYSGTCQMGSSLANGVISSHDLHVFGTKHLMVADNSIYPFPETGNTRWQAMMAGIKAANILGFNLP